MKSAAQQIATHRKLVKIACSVERLKRMIVGAANKGLDPDEESDSGKKRWEMVDDEAVARYVNFANVFLFAGNATIKVVDKEPDPKVQLVLPE